MLDNKNNKKKFWECFWLENCEKKKNVDKLIALRWRWLLWIEIKRKLWKLKVMSKGNE